MKKFLATIVVLSLLLTCAVTFIGCAESNNEQAQPEQNNEQNQSENNNNNQTSQQIQTEEYLDASIGEAILLQAYANTDEQTNIKVVYSSTAFDTYNATFIKVGTGDDVKTKCGYEAIGYDDDIGTYTESYSCYTIKVDNVWYDLTNFKCETTSETINEKYGYIKESSSGGLTPISAMSLLNVAAKFDADVIAGVLSDEAVVTCKKITNGSQVSYKIKVTQSESRLSVEYIIQNDVIISLNGKIAVAELDLTGSFTYNYTEFETVNINEYTIED